VRAWTALLLLPACAALATPPSYAPVHPAYTLAFPRDHGAHPDHRTEWWYVTGWLETARGETLGFQVTFFRSRPPVDAANPSRFAARQLLLAHAAVGAPKLGRLLHAQRARREGFGLATAKIGDTDVSIDDWSLRRDASGRYAASVSTGEFSLELELHPTQPILLQGDRGYSRKGPLASHASHYYSVPHLRAHGTLTRAGRGETVEGSAWLDHEWSSTLLAAEAVGWDWFGLNLDDGGALTVFRMRDAGGGTLHSYARLRRPDGRVASGTATLQALRNWRSPRSGAAYPVAWRVEFDELAFDLQPLMDDQEIDARASTGTVYWEGAVTALSGGRRIGRGYLELTGYFKPIRF
jgi:predicted secreted hydrolase